MRINTEREFEDADYNISFEYSVEFEDIEKEHIKDCAKIFDVLTDELYTDGIMDFANGSYTVDDLCLLSTMLTSIADSL